MGQYFRPLVVAGGKKLTARTREFGSCSKLTEHSFIGDDMVNAALYQLFEKKGRLAWLGEFSDEENILGYNLGGGYVKDKEDYLSRFYYPVWGQSAERLSFLKSFPYGDEKIFNQEDTESFIDLDRAGYFAINFTKGIYFSLEAYVKEWRRRGPKIPDLCFNPLPLLTAVGNGLGGGDFHKGNEGYEDVGTWAFDEIMISKTKPEGFTEVHYFFEEGGELNA